MLPKLLAAAALCASATGVCWAQDAPESKAIYDGWRARQLMGSSALAKADGRAIGQVGDIIVDADGRIAALIVQGGGPLQLPDFVYRVPWQEVDLTPGKPGVVLDLSDAKRPRYGLFPGTENVPTLPREFRITEVIGDYARLQTGHGYGYVTDVIFTQDARLAAVLVTRTSPAGASAAATVAFPFPGVQSRWDPSASYFGLPHVTAEQADKAAVAIEASRLSQATL